MGVSQCPPSKLEPWISVLSSSFPNSSSQNLTFTRKASTAMSSEVLSEALWLLEVPFFWWTMCIWWRGEERCEKHPRQVQPSPAQHPYPMETPVPPWLCASHLCCAQSLRSDSGTSGSAAAWPGTQCPVLHPRSWPPYSGLSSLWHGRSRGLRLASLSFPIAFLIPPSLAVPKRNRVKGFHFPLVSH